MPGAAITLRPMPFEEAIRAAERRRIVLPEVFYGELQAQARAEAWTVARLAQLDQIQSIMDSLIEAERRGLDFRAWKRALIESGRDFGLSPGHLETIFRTNLQAHYATGRAQAILANADTHPYLRYDAIMDTRVRPEHADLHGIILPVDHPFWQTHFPPLGFNCRCTVVSLTARQAERLIEQAAEQGRVINQPPPGTRFDRGWGYDRLHGSTGAGMERAVARRAGQCTPRLYARSRDPANILWCDGPGASVLAQAAAALRWREPMPEPRNAPGLRMPPGLGEREYLRAFMGEFGDPEARMVMFRSVSGQVLAISDDLFRKQSGASKLAKRGRDSYVRYVALGIRDPDEVWYLREGSQEKLYFFGRFATGQRQIGVLAVFRWDSRAWAPVTGYQGGSPAYIAAERERVRTRGYLLFRR